MKNEKLVENLDRAIAVLFILLAFVIPFTRGAIEITASLLIVLWVVKLLVSRQFPVNKFTGALAIFLGANLLSALFSRDLIRSLDCFFFKTFEYILLSLIALDTIRTRRRMKFLLAAFFLSAFILCLDGLWQLGTGYDLFRHRGLEVTRRVSASFVNANDLGTYLIAILPLAITSFISHFVAPRVKSGPLPIRRLAVLILFMLLILFLANSKGAYIGFLAGLLIMIFLSRNKKLAFGALGISLVFILLTVGHAEKSFLKSSRFNDRLKIWQGAVQMVVNRPFFGEGLGTFMDAYGHDYFAGARTEHRFTYAHNCLLQHAAETGLVGFFSLVWLIIALFSVLIRSIRRTRDKFVYFTLIGFSGAITANLIHSLFDTNLYSLQLAVLFWVIVGTSVGFAENSKNLNYPH